MQVSARLLYFGFLFIGAARFTTQSSTLHRRYIVKLKDEITAASFINEVKTTWKFFENDALKVIHTYGSVLNGFSAMLSPKLATWIRKSDLVEYVEEDSLMWTSQMMSSVWGLDRIDQIQLPLDGFYDPIGNGSDVNIYIVDTGINVGHVDFNSRASVAYDALGGEGVDCNGHGSHCAGVAAGSVYGVAKGASLFGVRVLNCQGSGYVSDIIEGCDWIVNHGIPPAVVSFSLSGSSSEALDTAVENLLASGFFVTVAAGNNGKDACNYSPARVPQAITTAAIDQSDSRAYFSNYGRCVDIFAPGVSIESVWIGGDEDTNIISGTSVASPHTAGAVAIYVSKNPSLTPSELKSAILDAAVVGVVQSEGVGTPNRLLYVGPSEGDVNTPRPQVCEEYFNRSGSEFSSPNFPNQYDNHERCEYRVESEAGEFVLLQFNSFDVEFQESCSYDVVKVYDGLSTSDNLIGSLCGETLPGPIYSTGNAMLVTFESDGSEIANGFSGVFTFVEERPTTTLAPTPGPDGLRCSCPRTCTGTNIYSRNYPEDYNNDEVCEYAFTAPSGYYVYMAWEDVDIETSVNCRQDSLKVYDGPTRLDDLLANVCGRRLPSAVSSTGRRKLARFVTSSNNTGGGFLARYRFIEQYCNQVFTVSGSVFASPNYPDEYDDNTNCSYTALAGSDETVTLTFQDFDLEDGNCEFDSIVVYDGRTTNDTVLAVHCGGDIPPPVTSSGPSMLVVFQSDPSVTESGFMGIFTFNPPTTPPITTTSVFTTVVTTPKRSTTYSPTTVTTAVQTTDDVGTTMVTTPAGTTPERLTTTMQPNTTEQLTTEQLTTTEQLATTVQLLTTELPTTRSNSPTSQSPSTMMTSVLPSTATPVTTMFPGPTLECTCQSACNGTFLYSPNYPSDYNNDETCEYRISTIFPNTLRLKWVAFALQSSVTCRSDSVEVYDGLTDSDTLLGTLCGTELPNDVVSSGTDLFIRFTTNAANTDSGFLATLESQTLGCNGLYTAPSGQVTSPNYPNEYDIFLDCEYRIVVSQGRTISLTFEAFSLEQSSSCQFDYLEIYDVVNGGLVLSGVYCGSETPPDVTSTGNELRLIFRTDDSVVETGFLATYVTNS